MLEISNVLDEGRDFSRLSAVLAASHSSVYHSTF